MLKFFRKFFSWTLTYKTLEFFQSIYLYIKAYYYISDTLYSDEFKHVIRRYLNIELKKDWIGRLYGVVNPNIDLRGQYNFNNTIIEIDGDNTNNDEYVKNWVFKQMDLIDQLFKIKKLYDYISVDIKHVGPEYADNYLVVFDMVNRTYFVNSFKKFFKHGLVYAVVAVIAALIIL